MFEWTINSPAAGLTEVRLKGEITEQVDFSKLELAGTDIFLIGDGVRYINSTGVKRLLAFLEELAGRATLHAVRWSPALVAQLNHMPRLAANLEIESVIAPLECSECVAVVDVLVEVAGSAPIVAARACEVCGAKMQLAELERRYFAFAVAELPPAS